MTRDTRAPLPQGVGSQTLDRGLHTLEILAGAASPLSVIEIAERAGLHRSITYRMVRTLEHRGFIVRGEDGRYVVGARLAVLARGVASTLRDVAAPRLVELAERTGRTAFLVVPEGQLALTVHVEEPRTTMAHIAYRPGVQHPITQGAPGLAILAGEEPQAGERPEITLARGRGWAQSHGEVIPDYRSCAAPIHDGSGRCVGAIAIVFVGAAPTPDLGEQVVAAARAVGSALHG
ncbi:MAG: IclR family transcriptional regulator [Ornithinimicrobium sp.]|uniref:IclR family transcriptional regulator n=1 Tax=Ornithinimicrobium sp. TaxID=1977084 RepID=UPI0026DF534A|nr:IclR family transcriptional regulator [Ornithinimicrobium sp.]MDO5738684.1 IclR family transcriptional regulator [Ornithinimicrobium sp.]